MRCSRFLKKNRKLYRKYDILFHMTEDVRDIINKQLGGAEYEMD